MKPRKICDIIIECLVLKCTLLLLYLLLNLGIMDNKFLKLTNTVYKVLEFFPESDPLKNRAKDKALSIMEHLVLINETSGWASFQKEKVKVQLLEDIDIFLGYLWIGKSQSWLNSVNCLIITNEYEKIKKEIGPIIEPIMELTQKLPGIDSSPTNFELKEVADEKEMFSPKLTEDKSILQESIQTSAESVLDNTEAKEEEIPDCFVSNRQKKILEFLGKNEKAQVMDLQTILPDITKRTIRRDLDELLEAGKIARFGDFNQVFYKISEAGHR